MSKIIGTIELRCVRALEYSMSHDLSVSILHFLHKLPSQRDACFLANTLAVVEAPAAPGSDAVGSKRKRS